MKTSAVALAVILSSLVFSQTSSATANPPGCDSGRSHATSCLAKYYGTVYVNGFGSAFIPCLNHGKGENVVFSDVEETIFRYAVTAGKRNGYFMSVGGGMHGKGQTTGINYTARGSTQDSFANWVPYNPDGSFVELKTRAAFPESGPFFIRSDSFSPAISPSRQEQLEL